MSKITVSDYLIQELNKLGIDDFFGLPGDYNFNILYSIENNSKTNWIGCTNELNAGYAADGYARVKGYGALVTTFGVGELSAMNAVAGSYAENIPVIKITGAPKSVCFETNKLIHHNYSNPDYFAFQKAFENVTETTAFLTKDNAKEEIDRVLKVFVRENRPVYVSIPIDVCKVEIDNSPVNLFPKSDVASLDKVVEHCKKLIAKSKNVSILADSLVDRYKAKSALLNLVDNSKLPSVNLMMAGGIIPSSTINYKGTFLREFGNQGAYDVLEKSDCVISVGVINSDLNSYNYKLPFATTEYIDIQGTYTVVENVKYHNILMKDILDALSSLTFEQASFEDSKIGVDSVKAKEGALLSSEYIYPRIQEFLKEGDLIFAETGIVLPAISELNLPDDAIVNTQALWGSIGWATPASFGAQVADKDKRIILITGEGSHQLTAQSISNMMKHNLRPIVIVLNNSGYTIERILSEDPYDAFNDIIKWDYSKLPDVFEGECWIKQAKTEQEFDDVLNQAEIQQKNKMCYIEIFTDKMDVPSITTKIINSLTGKGD